MHDDNKRNYMNSNNRSLETCNRNKRIYTHIIVDTEYAKQQVTLNIPIFFLVLLPLLCFDIRMLLPFLLFFIASTSKLVYGM